MLAALDNEDNNESNEDVNLLSKLDDNLTESEESDDDDDDNDKHDNINVKQTLKQELAWYVRLYLAQLLHDGHSISYLHKT